MLLRIRSAHLGMFRRHFCAVYNHAGIEGVTCTGSTSYMVGRGNKRANIKTMFPAQKKKNNEAAGYTDLVKIELLKHDGRLKKICQRLL